MDEKIGDRDRYVIGHKEMRNGIGGSENKLDDLKARQNPLEGHRNFDIDCRERVVDILDQLVGISI